MKMIRKTASVILVIFLLFSHTVMAENEVENNSSVEKTTDVEIEQTDEANEIVDKLETLLDPENDELEKEVTETLEKNSDNWFVKLFKTIIDAISSFLDAVLELASEAAKIGVD